MQRIHGLKQNIQVNHTKRGQPIYKGEEEAGLQTEQRAYEGQDQFSEGH